MARGLSLEEWLDQRVSVQLVQAGGSAAASRPLFAHQPITGQLNGISEWGVMLAEVSGGAGQASKTTRFYPWGAIRSILLAPEEREQSS
jgi:hypothetical protein